MSGNVANMEKINTVEAENGFLNVKLQEKENNPNNNNLNK